MIATSDLIMSVQMGLVLGAVPAGIALVVGIFWRVLGIMS